MNHRKKVVQEYDYHMNLGGGGYIQSESGQDSFEYEEDTRSVVQTNGSHRMDQVDKSPQGDW